MDRRKLLKQFALAGPAWLAAQHLPDGLINSLNGDQLAAGPFKPDWTVYPPTPRLQTRHFPKGI